MGLDRFVCDTRYISAYWGLLGHHQSCHAGGPLISPQMSRVFMRTQAVFSAGIIILVEKLFLQFVAINFHQKALADRVAENRLGLKALDRLSNAQPSTPHKKPPHGKRGHKSPANSIGNSLDLSGPPRRIQEDAADGSPTGSDKGDHSPARTHKKRSKSAVRQRQRRKAMASVIVDQVGPHPCRDSLA